MLKQKQTRFIRTLLYSLKKGYGFPVTFYKIDSETYDLETGERTPITSYKKIQKVIILPEILQQKFEYDLAYIAASKNFTYGGTYETGVRKVIVDYQDLGDFNIEMDNYFIWDGQRYQITQVFDVEFQTAFLVVGRRVDGSPRYMIEEVHLESVLQITQEIT